MSRSRKCLYLGILSEAALAAVILLIFAGPLYTMTVWAFDYSIVALDVKSGQVIWEVRPDRLGFPYMCLRGEVIEAVWNDRNYRGTKTLIDQRTGRIIGSSDGDVMAPCAERSFLDMAPPNIETSDGRVFAYNEEGGASFRSGNETTRLRSFNGTASEINVFRDLVLFYWWPRQGEVYALDNRSGRVAWRFEGWRLAQPDRWQDHNARLYVIEDKVFIIYRSNIFCLEAFSGKVVWQHKFHLPVELLNEGPNPIVWSVGGSTLAVYYEWLYLFGKNGDLSWEYNAGTLGGSFPLLVDDRLYVAARTHARRGVETEAVPCDEKALRVTWSEGTFLFEHVLLKDIPGRVPVWSELNRPETKADCGRSVLLTFMDTEIYLEDRSWSLDVTSVLTPESVVYVHYDREIDRVRVAIDGEVRAESDLPLTKE